MSLKEVEDATLERDAAKHTLEAAPHGPFIITAVSSRCPFRRFLFQSTEDGLVTGRGFGIHQSERKEDGDVATTSGGTRRGHGRCYCQDLPSSRAVKRGVDIHVRTALSLEEVEAIWRAVKSPAALIWIQMNANVVLSGRQLHQVVALPVVTSFGFPQALFRVPDMMKCTQVEAQMEF